MTFLVTGGTGFIGSAVVHNLVERGERVVCADRFLDSQVLAHFPSQVATIQCDVGDDGQIASVFQAHPDIDHVVHLAYLMGAESEADPVAAMRVNALGTAALFAQSCAHGVRRVLFTSSESVYGRSQSIYGNRPVTEDDCCAPRDHVLNYSLTKLLNEHLAAKYEARFGTSIVSLRVAIAYGPGRKRGTTVWASDFATLPALGKPVTLPFPAHGLNCYIYVEDVAEQIYRLSSKPALAYRVYNSGGHTVSGAELAALVRQIVPEAQIGFNDDKPWSPFIYQMDDHRIRQELGYSLRSLVEGIGDHVAKVRRAPPPPGRLP